MSLHDLLLAPFSYNADVQRGFPDPRPGGGLCEPEPEPAVGP